MKIREFMPCRSEQFYLATSLPLHCRNLFSISPFPHRALDNYLMVKLKQSPGYPIRRLTPSQIRAPQITSPRPPSPHLLRSRPIMHTSQNCVLDQRYDRSSPTTPMGPSGADSPELTLSASLQNLVNYKRFSDSLNNMGDHPRIATWFHSSG